MARQRKIPDKVYLFLCRWKEEHDGNSPTYAQIAENFGWASESTAYWVIDTLELEGRVIRDENRQITIGGDYIPPA